MTLDGQVNQVKAVLTFSDHVSEPTAISYSTNGLEPLVPFSYLLRSVRSVNRSETVQIRTPIEVQRISMALAQLLGSISLTGADGRAYAFAPMRSRPQRTYDPVSDIPDAQGRHIPMVLEQLLHEESESAVRLHIALNTFGVQSGLFERLHVRRFGGDADPFQIVVKVGGKERNLIDVGYGVSQILPLLVEILRSPLGRMFLIQQPEVHLHPRAQAAFATFLATVVKERGHQFIVETHSDYIIDRIRMDVRDKVALSPEQVLTLYFEPRKRGTTIHPIRTDTTGNVLDAPPGYRQFFLEEERRFFGLPT